jgi:hypothetical protein
VNDLEQMVDQLFHFCPIRCIHDIERDGSDCIQWVCHRYSGYTYRDLEEEGSFHSVRCDCCNLQFLSSISPCSNLFLEVVIRARMYSKKLRGEFSFKLF